MQIYFAGSIRGGRNDQELYLQIIKLLSNYGTVLTEHIGDALVLEKEKGISDTAIFQRDVSWLQAADVVVAEVTTASLGVGYEVGLAEVTGKSILCLYRSSPGKQLSAMISGNAALSVKEYQTVDDLPEILKAFFEKVGVKK